MYTKLFTASLKIKFSSIRILYRGKFSSTIFVTPYNLTLHGWIYWANLNLLITQFKIGQNHISHVDKNSMVQKSPHIRTQYMYIEFTIDKHPCISSEFKSPEENIEDVFLCIFKWMSAIKLFMAMVKFSWFWKENHVQWVEKLSFKSVCMSNPSQYQGTNTN